MAGGEYDRRAEAWLALRFPGAEPDPGSVRFVTDCAAYASGGWAQIDVEWTRRGEQQRRTLADDAWDYDLTRIIRELLDVELP